MKLGDHIELSDNDPIGPTEELSIQFDDPPGPSPARYIGPLLDVESLRSDLRAALKSHASEVEVGGLHSGAFTGESYAIILFVLAGLTGGVLGAVGEDLWNGVKSVLTKAAKRNAARRNVVEVTLAFEEIDIILHIESRNPNALAEHLAEADSLLVEIRRALTHNQDLFRTTRAIEIRTSNGKEFSCIRYLYPRGKQFLLELKGERPGGRKGSRRKPNA